MLTKSTSPSSINVGQLERTASIISGGVLILSGVRQSGLKGLIVAALGGASVYRGITGHCQLYQAMGINTAGAPAKSQAPRPINVEQGIRIQCPRTELFRFWRRLENLPMIMSHLSSVERIDSHRSRWTAITPTNQKIAWEAEITDEQEDELIAWRSTNDSEVQCSGSVRFEDAGANESIVRVNLEYVPSAGNLGATIAGLLGADPANELCRDLQNFKSAMEDVAPSPSDELQSVATH